MKCTRCGNREATIHSYVSINNKKQHMDLCEDCARELQAGMGMGEYGDMFGGFFGQSPMGLLPGLFKLLDTPTTRKIVCPVCKTTGEEFLKTGFVGCPHCYEEFEPLIIQSVKKFQTSDRHIGKSPSGGETPAEAETRLKAEMQAAFDAGDYKKLGELTQKLNKLLGNK